jgi:hypothetical protein
MEELIKIVLDNLIDLWPTLFSVLGVMRIIAIIVSVIFVIAIIILLRLNDYLIYRFAEPLSDLFIKKPYLGIRIGREWKEIVKRVKEGDEEERKLAVADADEILNESLNKLGFGGDNLEEKLERVSEDIFPTAEEIKAVHQESKNIIYNPDKELSKKEAMRIIDVYEKTIKELQIF